MLSRAKAVHVHIAQIVIIRFLYNERVKPCEIWTRFQKKTSQKILLCRRETLVNERHTACTADNIKRTEDIILKNMIIVEKGWLSMGYADF